MQFDVVFHPKWWYKNAGISFDAAFWDEPETRMQADMKMRRTLFEKFGGFGLGEEKPEKRPLLGSDMLACGWLASSMLGCNVRFAEDDAPQVVCAELNDEAALGLTAPDIDANPVWQKVQEQIDYLMHEYGRVESHLNLMGVQNVAMDLRGQQFFIDYYDDEDIAKNLLEVSCQTLTSIGERLRVYTDELSAGVTSITSKVAPKVYLTSNCSVEMVSLQTYEDWLFEYDERMARKFGHFGVHHCGKSTERVVSAYARLSSLEFIEVGAGSDLAAVNAELPENVLFNARYSPVKLARDTAESIRTEVERMCSLVPDRKLSISCVGIDADVSDENIKTFLGACSKAQGTLLADL